MIINKPKYFVRINVSKDNFVVSIKGLSFIKTNLAFSMDKTGFENFLSFTYQFKSSFICAFEPARIYHTNLLV
ncbi:hypothetical protein J7K43_08280 [Candidatus Calescamantes bacterium]|nr:hypothetical protein [Candidatus Calescamantes bacterium]